MAVSDLSHRFERVGRRALEAEIGERWTLHLREAFFGMRQFQVSSRGTRHSAATLSSRLRMLDRVGL